MHGTNFRTCQNLVSACLMAHVNTAGVHIPIWMASEAPQIGWGLDLVNYPKQEGTFFGNIIETGSLTEMGMTGVTGPVAYYCDGAGFADGTVKGRLGVGQSGANLPYKNQYGGTCNGNQNFVGAWSAGNSGQVADGYKTAVVNGYVFQNGEPITVWRNPNTSSGGTSSTTIQFSPAYAYRLMPKHVSGKSVDVAYASTNNGTAVQQWGNNTNTAQKFAILASGSNWKLAMTINTNKCVGPAYNGTGNSDRGRDPGLQRWKQPGLDRHAGLRHHRHVQLQERGVEPLPGCRRRQHGGWRPHADLRLHTAATTRSSRSA